MNIYVEKFKIEVTEQELYDLMFALRDKLLSTADHCKRHDGIGTLEKNYSSELGMLKQMSVRLDREFVYSDMLAKFKKLCEPEQP